MFNKLKNAVGDNAIRSAINTYADQISQKLEEVTMLTPIDVSNDEHYRNKVIAPALIVVVASASGATKLIPNFDQRFDRAMLHVRDQLIIVDTANNKISLAPDYKSRVGDVLVEGFLQSA